MRSTQQPAHYFSVDPAQWTPDDLVAVADMLSERKLQVRQVDIDALVRARLEEQVTARGVSALLRRPQRLREDILCPGTPDETFASLVASMVSTLAPTRSLTVVDPYLLNPRPRTIDDAVGLIVDVLRPALTHSVPVLFCYMQAGERAKEESKENERAMRAALEREFSSTGVEFIESDVFHDRFVIADGHRGLVLGTSFNGVGRKYFLVDYLQDTDAETIAKAVDAARR